MHIYYIIVTSQNNPFLLLQITADGIIGIGNDRPDNIPESFPKRDPVIAPLWGDSDTTAEYGTVIFHQNNDPVSLDKAQQSIRAAFPGHSSFTPSYTYIITWRCLGYNSRNTDLVSQ